MKACSVFAAVVSVTCVVALLGMMSPNVQSDVNAQHSSMLEYLSNILNDEFLSINILLGKQSPGMHPAAPKS